MPDLHPTTSRKSASVCGLAQIPSILWPCHNLPGQQGVLCNHFCFLCWKIILHTMKGRHTNITNFSNLPMHLKMRSILGYQVIFSELLSTRELIWSWSKRRHQNIGCLICSVALVVVWGCGLEFQFLHSAKCLTTFMFWERNQKRKMGEALLSIWENQFLHFELRMLKSFAKVMMMFLSHCHSVLVVFFLRLNKRNNLFQHSEVAQNLDNTLSDGHQTSQTFCPVLFALSLAFQYSVSWDFHLLRWLVLISRRLKLSYPSTKSALNCTKQANCKQMPGEEHVAKFLSRQRWLGKRVCSQKRSFLWVCCVTFLIWNHCFCSTKEHIAGPARLNVLLDRFQQFIFSSLKLTTHWSLGQLSTWNKHTAIWIATGVFFSVLSLLHPQRFHAHFAFVSPTRKYLLWGENGKSCMWGLRKLLPAQCGQI